MLLRSILVALVVAAFTIVSSTQISAQTFVDRVTPEAFRVVSYNMFWDELFNHPVNAPDELERMIDALDADVYCFQECFSTTAADAVSLFNLLEPLPGGASWKGHKARNQIIVSRYGLSLQALDVPNGTRGIAMAQVDLPDAVFENDLYILNNHYPCCNNETQRLHESQVIIDWMNDARFVGGNIDLEPGTGILVLGDLNAVNGSAPVDILLDGYNGLTSDWDDSSSSDSLPLHNVVGPEAWTWRDDPMGFAPGVLDFVLYTDSVLKMDHRYILNPWEMSAAELATTGLQATDFMFDKQNPQANSIDHLPLVVDFVPSPFQTADQSKLLDGVTVAGGQGDADQSDNVYWELNPSPTNNPQKQIVDMIFEAQTDVVTPVSMAIRIEARMGGGLPGDVIQTINVFNFATNRMELLDQRPVNDVDEFVQVPIDGVLADYINPITSEVRAKVTWKSQEFSGAAFQWDLAIDQLGWAIDGATSAPRNSSGNREQHQSGKKTRGGKR